MDKNETKERIKHVRMIISDFDGVMTDNRVLVDENGVESVFCNRADGLGIEMLRRKGIDFVVLSKEKNKVVEARCKKLGIKCYSGIDDKKEVFLKIIEEKKIKNNEVCFVGNDINDLECIKLAYVSIAPSDAHVLVLNQASYVTKTKGGYGVIREVADLII